MCIELMKPEGWEQLTPKEKRQAGLELLESMRGQYIVSQALSVAIEVMEKEPDERREESNIEDMVILYESVFPLYIPRKKREELREEYQKLYGKE